MAYEKKLCILKQIGKGFTADGMPLMGAVYAERLGSDLTLTPRIAGLAPLREGRYALAAVVGRKEYCLELKGNTALRVPACPSLENGFAVLLCFVKDDVEPVAFGSCGSAPSDYKQLVDLFRTLPKERANFSSPSPARSAVKSEEDEGQRIPPMPLPPTGVPGVPGPNTPFAPGVPLPSGPSDKPLPPEPPPEEDEPLSRAPEDVSPEASGNAPPRDGYDDEALAGKNYYSSPEAAAPEPPPEEPPRALTYFESIRPRMEEAFQKGTPDTRLCRALPHSEWTLWEGALLGVVYHLGVPRYVCLAVEAQGELPREMEERAVFVPSSPYSDDEGFFVAFQDAATGEFVK